MPKFRRLGIFFSAPIITKPTTVVRVSMSRMCELSFSLCNGVSVILPALLLAFFFPALMFFFYFIRKGYYYAGYIYMCVCSLQVGASDGFIFFVIVLGCVVFDETKNGVHQ